MRIAQQDTAIDAYHAHHAAGKAGVQCHRIMRFIELSGEDWSIGEIAFALHMEKSTVSARINELIAEKQLVDKPKRKDRRSGITIRPVGLPDEQQELFQ